ncbi:MAG TPA: IPT/TIG domain-containing protein, partial [Candidatus Sulfotelmatobacter sp.]|nr:IPT/TIG domain-containing protein [Candidatus Sulfotelmatobacter sp.]
LSAMTSVTMNVNWDGSANSIKFGFKDSAGHVTVATVSNSTLMALGNSYAQISIPLSSFSEDTTDPTRTTGAINWAQVTNYSFAYINKGTTPNYQYIDDITAQLGTPPIPTGEVVITNISPSSAPTGARIVVSGHGFGASQGQSVLAFNNTANNVSYPATIISWDDGSIEALVPQTAPIGGYNVVVNRLSIISGVVNALQSNPAAFQVTNSGVETAHIYPNPFDPNSQVVHIDFTQPSGTTNIGVYIYDMTARQVNKQMISSGNTTWNGRDLQNSLAADGAYLLRVVNEDTKTLLAKGKILVVKR